MQLHLLHQPYFIFINTANPKIATPKYIHVNSLNPVAISNFVKGIKLSNIYNKLNKCTDADPNETYDIINSEIELNKNIHLPEKMVKFKKYSHKNSCWITTGILRSIKYRDKLYKQLKCTNPDTLLYRNLYVNLNSFNNYIEKKHSICQAYVL